MSNHKTRYVYVVLYCYDYEGCQLQAVYRRKRDADQHPSGGDEKRIEKMPLRGRFNPRLHGR